MRAQLKRRLRATFAAQIAVNNNNNNKLSRYYSYEYSFCIHYSLIITQKKKHSTLAKIFTIRNFLQFTFFYVFTFVLPLRFTCVSRARVPLPD